MDAVGLEFFQQNSWVPLGKVLSDSELQHFQQLYDDDLPGAGSSSYAPSRAGKKSTVRPDATHAFSWMAQGIQSRNYEVLVTRFIPPARAQDAPPPADARAPMHHQVTMPCAPIRLVQVSSASNLVQVPYRS